MARLPEIIVDSFAGGGGASEGIERALRRLEKLGLLPEGVAPHVNVAINHDDAALAMHAANHPHTLHLPHDIWRVDPRATVGPNPVGLLWASPDCRHHSKAKGGRPVSASVRDLAWVVAHWAEQVRPRLIFLENVEEFRDWGPLVGDDKGDFRPCKKRRGQHFRKWVSRFERMGYKVETCEIRACDLGAPTIRKRLYIIMRCDGEPIVWPWATHAAPDSEDVQSGRLKPHRIAAELIDWDRPCPSILMSRDEAKAYTAETGTRIIRPLAENTERRVARGIKRYVLDAAEPFIVTCNHSGDHFRGQGLGDPFATVTRSRDGHGLVVPLMTYGQHGGLNRSADDPMHTVTASRKDTNAMACAALAPTFVSVNHGYSGGRREYPVTEVFNTVTREQSRGLVSAFLARQFGASIGSHPGQPLGTVTAGGGGKTQAVAAFLAQHSAGSHPGRPARGLDESVSTITGRATQQGLVAAHMMALKGSSRRAMRVDQPHGAVTAGGQHSAVVSLPLFNTYYGSDEHGAGICDPVRTVSTRDRLGLVDCGGAAPPLTDALLDSARQVAAFLRKYDCWDDGEFVTVGPFIIYDIGMRMLTPRELARAQGFTDDYILAAPHKGKPLNETAQRHKIGNSVCPDVAEALVFANYRPQLRAANQPPQGWLLDIPLEAAE